MSILLRRRYRLGLSLKVLGAVAIAFTNPTFAFSSPTQSPEKATLQAAKTLRGISDGEWKQIAGEQIQGKYDITRGDTLYDISKRLFGDARYWPKIWAMNNGTILNPHMIRPGNRIVFMPGTGTSLPTVAVVASADEGRQTATDYSRSADTVRAPARSQEWRMLPTQDWEASRIEADQAALQDLKVMGDLDKVHTLTPTRELSIFAASQPVQLLGQIVSAPTSTTYLKVGDQVLIQGMSDELNAGETFAVTHDPDVLEKDKKKRQGFGYHVDGELRIIGSQDGYWIGVITQGRSLMYRGSYLTQRTPRLKPLAAIPAPAAQSGQFYVDKGVSTSMSGQYSYGFVNLGSEDGLQEGMILESYENMDLNTGKKLIGTNLFHVADMQVVQVSERFSTVLIVSGITEVYDGMPVRLLTDVSNFQNYGAIPITGEQPTDISPEVPPQPEPTPSPAPSPSETSSPPAEDLPPPAPEASATSTPQATPTNDLDALDGEDKLNAEEKRELQQLENYKAKDPSAGTDVPPPSPPVDAESTPPPPPPADADTAVPPADSSTPPVDPSTPPADAGTESVPPPTAPVDSGMDSSTDSSSDSGMNSGDTPPPPPPVP
jgi:hypothetical protein